MINYVIEQIREMMAFSFFKARNTFEEEILQAGLSASDKCSSSK